MTARFARYLGFLIVILALILPAVPATGIAAQPGFPLPANTAFCEPGYMGPFVDCTPWEGVAVTYVALDQEFEETCVTVAGDRTAGCTVEVPFGSTIVASIDPAVIPAGYVLEGPASLQFEIPAGPPDGIFGGPSFVLLPAGEQPQAPAAGFPLSANTAYCDPGYLGPFVDCAPWEGVVVSVATTDGALATSCVTSGTERAAGCVVEVPFGSTVVASIDPDAIPAGYVLEGPASVEIAIPGGPPEGESGGAAFVLLPAVQEPAATTAPIAPAAGGIPAGIYTGPCTDIGPEDLVAALSGLRYPAGEPVGAADALPVATSFTQLPIAFGQATDGSHVIAVFAEDSPETLLACGPIGGNIDENDALTVGLRPAAGPSTAGIVYLAPDGDGSITVSVFLGEPTARATPAPGT